MSIEHAQFHDNMEPALRVWTMPKDTNPAGDIFGGWIMSQVDMAGAIVAAHHVQGKVVTVAVTDFLFRQPVFVGDLISCYGKIVKTGRTSITVAVEVCAQREKIGTCIKVTEATLVYVALGDDRKPKVINP